MAGPAQRRFVFFQPMPGDGTGSVTIGGPPRRAAASRPPARRRRLQDVGVPMTIS